MKEINIDNPFMKKSQGLTKETMKKTEHDNPSQYPRNKEYTEKQVIDAIEAANKSFVGKYTRLEFSIHEKTKEILVKVFDQESDELIREIPSEKFLDLLAHIWEAAGILVDSKV